MLRSLAISDFVLIPRLDLEFGPGLTVITGETGVGKSILLGAVRLLLGGRADSDVVRAGSERAVVEAMFELREDHPVRDLLAAQGYRIGDELLIRRTVPARAGGRGQITVCGQMVTGAMLREATAGLVAVSSQHEQRTLSDPATHVALLDAFAGCGETAAQVERRYRALAAARGALDDIVREHAGRLERAEWLRERVRELERAALRPGESAELEADIAVVRAGARLAEALERAAEALSEADEGRSALAQIVKSERALGEAAKVDPRLRPLVAQIAEARAVAEDAARDLAAYRDRAGHDPARLETMEDRLHLIRRLVRAHGGTEEAAAARLLEMRAELDLVDRHEDHRAAAESAAAAAETSLDEAAEELSGIRRKAARRLAKEITAGLSRLGMSGAAVEMALRPAQEGLVVRGRAVGARGAEVVEMLFAPNPGEGARPLGRIASGGELSRLLLAVKRVLADREPVATYVFDEVDAGVSGEAAQRVAAAIREVSMHHQVICVTHLPAVAARGDHHIWVEKSEEGGRTITRARTLDRAERIDAIARLLGGAEAGARARAAAAELLGRARAEAE